MKDNNSSVIGTWGQVALAENLEYNLLHSQQACKLLHQQGIYIFF